MITRASTHELSRSDDRQLLAMIHRLRGPVGMAEARKDLELLRLLLGEPELAGPMARELGLVSRDEAMELGESVTGDFVPGFAYKAHPMDPRMFIPVSSFHHWVLEDKKAEFLRICASLGARTLELVEHARDESGRGFDVGVKEPTGRVDVGASHAREHEASEVFSMRYLSGRSPGTAPRLPKGLRWFPHEPLWQAMGETRIKHGASSLDVKFTQNDHFGLSTSVAAGIERMGFSLGGTFRRAHTVSHGYRVEFWPVP
jgi:hypothetical protein